MCSRHSRAIALPTTRFAGRSDHLRGVLLMENFFSDLLAELERSLAASFSFLSGGHDDVAVQAARLLEQLLVSAVLVMLVGGVYLLVRGALGWLLERRGAPAAFVTPMVRLLRYVAFLAATLMLMAQLGVPEQTLAVVARAAIVAIGFYVAWMLATGLLLQTLARYGLDRSIEQLLRNLVGVVIVAFGVITVLSQFGFDILSVIAGLGIVGLAVGFAAQSTLANFIAGITLLLERPFQIGDWVEINGQTGKVMEIALRTTRLRTRDNIYTVIPNSSVAEADIVNLSAGGPLRVRIPVGIAYKESVSAARQAILPLISAHEYVLQAPDMMPAVVMSALGDSSVDLTVLYWVSPESIDIQPRVSAQLLESIKEALDAAGIQIPFPHLQLFIDEAKGLGPVVDAFHAGQRS